jgi:hypothetical protein
MDFVYLPVDSIRTHGLKLPQGVGRSGVYRLTMSNGDHYLGQTQDLIVRMGGHARTYGYSSIASLEFQPILPSDLDVAFRELEARRGPSRWTRRGLVGPGRVGSGTSPIDPYLDRVQWIETNLAGIEEDRLTETPGQRERTRPKFDQLSSHPEFEHLRSLIALFLERVIPDPPATECRNWVITSMPSTARTRVWHRLVCLSVNNIEALTIGEQFDGNKWVVTGFISGAPLPPSSRLVLPAKAARAGAFIAPEFYKTVGDVTQVGFDSLAAFEILLDHDPVIDLVGELMMKLVRRGRGMYGRFHDYNLADAVLGTEPRPAAASRVNDVRE